MKKLLLLCAAVLAAECPVHAGGADKGTSTANFLKLGAGARAEAMGEAYTAVTDDALSVFWNVAGLTRVEARSAALMHASYIGSSYFDFLAYGQKLGGGWAGAGLEYFSAGSITETDPSGAALSDFSPSDMALTAGYALKLKSSRGWLDGVSVGAGVKYVRSKVVTSASALALDLGVLTPAYAGGKLNFGLAVANLGGKMKFDSEKEDLPFAVKGGAAYRFSDRLLASADVSLPRDNSAVFAAGAEYRYPAGDKNFFGRAGYTSRNKDIGGFSGMAFGVGFGFGKYSFDYALAPYGDLGSTHRISLSAKF